MKSFPQIESVYPLSQYRLLVTFRNGVQKIYDCSDLLKKQPFHLLENLSLFQSVTVDQGGYGVIWDDNIDLAESELWLHGEEVTAKILKETTGPLETESASNGNPL